MRIKSSKNKEMKNTPFSSLVSFNILSRDQNLKRLLIITILIFVIMSLLKPDKFFTFNNLESMAFQFPEFGLLSLAMLLAMLSGGIDLSVVGIANLSSIFAALIFTNMLSADATGGKILLVTLLAILVALVTGVICGLLNGFLIARIGITPILTTLGTMQLFTGIAIRITEGHSIFGFPEGFLKIGNESLLIFPIPFIMFIVITILISVMLNKTTFGYKLYMMGANPTAARFSGINNIKITIKTYMLSGLLAALAAIILMSRTNSAKADYGTSYTLQAVLVAILGGVNYEGGFGNVAGIVLAVLSLQFLSSGFNIMRFSPFIGEFVWGALLITVMAANYILDKRKSKKVYNFPETQKEKMAQ